MFFVQSKNRRKRITFLIGCIVVYLMTNMSLDNWDNWNYSNVFTAIETGDSVSAETGYVFLNHIAVNLKLDYTGFRYMYLILFTWILFYLAFRITEGRTEIFLLTYLIYFIFKDAEQLRMFAAYVIILAGLRHLYEDKSSVIKYLGYCLLAMQFHSSAVIFVCIAPIFSAKRFCLFLKKIVLIFSIVLSITAILNRNIFLMVLQQLIMMVSPERAESYIYTQSRFGFLVPLFLFILNFCVVFYIDRKLRVCEKRVIFNDGLDRLNVNRCMTDAKYTNFSYVIYILSLLAICTVPLLVMNLHFYRIGRCIFVFSTVFISGAHHILNRYEKILFVILFVILMTGYCYFDFIMFGSFESNVITLFQ